MALNELGLGFTFDAKDLASGVMDRVGNKLVDVAGKGTAAGDSMMRSMAQFGTGLSLVGAGLGVFALIGTATAEAKDFTKAINLVRTEVDEATFSNQKLRDVAIDMGKQFGKMPKDEAAALYKAVALGANTAEKATSLMDAANKLAVAGNSELSVTMDALGGALNAYGKSADQAGPVSDAFFVAMKNGNTTVQALASSVGRVSAGAHAMGIGIEEVLGSVSVMTNKGIQASEAVSYLHGALANITHPSHDAMIEARRLGIQFDASAVRAKGFVGFLDSITTSSKFNAKSLEKLFSSVEGSQAMAMLAGDMKSVHDVMGKMAQGAHATDEGFKIMSEGLDFQSDLLKSNISALKIRFGEFFEGSIGHGLVFVNKAINAFTNLPPPMLKLIATLATAAGTILVVLGSALMLKAAIALVGAGLSAAGITVGSFLATMLPLIAAIGLAVGVFEAFRYAVENNIGGIGTLVQETWAKIKLAFDALVSLFSTGGFSKALYNELSRAENDGVLQFAMRVYLTFARIKEFFSRFAEGVGQVFGTMGPTWQRLVQVVLRLGHALGFLTESNGGVEEAVGTWEKFGMAGLEAGQAIGRVIDFVVRVATAVLEIIDGIGIGWGKVAPSMAPAQAAFAQVWAALVKIGDALGITDPSASTSGWTKFGQVIGSVAGIVVNVLGAAFGVIGTILAGALDILSGFVHIIHGIFTGNWAEVWEGAKGNVLALLRTVGGVVLGILQLVTSLIDGIAKAFGKDLGLTAKLGGLKTDMEKALTSSTAAAAAPALARPGVAAAADAVAGPDAAAARQRAALADYKGGDFMLKGAPPVNVRTAITVQLDSTKVGEAMASYSANASDASGIPQEPGT